MSAVRRVLVVVVTAAVLLSCGSVDDPQAANITEPEQTATSAVEQEDPPVASTRMVEVPDGVVAAVECSDDASCALEFVLNGTVYSVSCGAVKETTVSGQVLGSGNFQGELVSVNAINAVDVGVLVAVSLPGGDCSETDPDERSSPWSMAFPDGADQKSQQEAICLVGDLSESQRLADGC